MANYLWKKLSDADRKKIERESKDLILEFGDALEKLPAREEVSVERERDSRDEGSGIECDSEFRDLMFENAPKVKDDCILGEKGSWTQ
tara:strand:+ start:347 stop:610 length:264 start_codon:yes stop_codon:yes gene_type:complete